MQHFVPVYLLFVLCFYRVAAQDSTIQSTRGGLEIRGVKLVDIRDINTLSTVGKQVSHLRHQVIVTPQGEKVLFNNLLSKKEKSIVRRVGTLNLWGENFTFYYDSHIKFKITDSLNKTIIRKYWNQLSESAYNPVLKQLNFISSYLSLNDWGYCMAVHKLAELIYPGQKNEQKIFENFILGKGGYESRLSYYKDRIYLLITSKQRIYGSRIDTLRSGNRWRKFYVIDIGEGLPDVPKAINLSARDIPYPAPSHKADGIDFKMKKTPNFILQPKTHEYTFQFKGKQYQLRAVLNKNLLEYYGSVPFLGPRLNFHSPLSISTSHTLIPQLKKITQGMEEKDAVNLILRFVQKGFSYKRDSVQFGKETYLVPEQTLASKASDCEDRCFLFASLVKKVLGLEAVGLQYDGHMAVGVNLTTNIPATYIPYNNVRYYICDPTMEGANLGQTLPEHTDKSAKLIFSE